MYFNVNFKVFKLIKVHLFVSELYKCITFLGVFVKLREATINFVVSVRPRGTTRFPLDEFSCKKIFQYFSKNPSRKFNFH